MSRTQIFQSIIIINKLFLNLNEKGYIQRWTVVKDLSTIEKEHNIQRSKKKTKSSRNPCRCKCYCSGKNINEQLDTKIISTDAVFKLEGVDSTVKSNFFLMLLNIYKAIFLKTNYYFQILICLEQFALKRTPRILAVLFSIRWK